MTQLDALDADAFASPDPAVRIDYLYRLRRATHRFIVRFGPTHWAQAQRAPGRLAAPPGITALPTSRQPEAMKITEATRLANAHLYGLDPAATTTAITLGPNMVKFTPSDAGPDATRAWSPVSSPPTPSGLLRWADTGVGYDATKVPLIAVHWGPLPRGGTWLAFWADNRIAVRHEQTRKGWTRDGAQLALHGIGPLAITTTATAITPRPDAEPSTQPPRQINRHDTLTATVLASWALLQTPGATHLITHNPSQAEAARDRRAGLRPRPATLATGPINPHIIQELGRNDPA